MTDESDRKEYDGLVKNHATIQATFARLLRFVTPDVPENTNGVQIKVKVNTRAPAPAGEVGSVLSVKTIN